MLYDAVVFICRLDHFLSLMDIMCGGLFNVHVLPGLAGPDGLQRMPVVGGRKGYPVDVLILVETAEILFNADFHPKFLLQLGRPLLSQGQVGISDGDQLHIRFLCQSDDLLTMGDTPLVHAQDGNSETVICPLRG